MERSCPKRARTRYSADPGDRRAFFQTDSDGANSNLGTAGFRDRRLRNRWVDDHGCKLHRIVGRRQNQLARRAIVRQVE